MNNIVFLYQQNGELGEFFSLYMPSILFKLNNITFENKHIENINSIKNSTVFIVKHISIENLEILKNNNNKIVLDLVDILAHQKEKFSEYLYKLIYEFKIDKLLVRQFDLTKALGNISYYIPHHYDYRVNYIEKINADNNATKISFPYTDPGGINLHKEYSKFFDIITIDGISHTNWEKIKQIHHLSMKNNFYFSVREEESFEYKFKPATKTAVCAAVGRCMITNEDFSLRDLLPIDYPYFFSPKKNFLDFYESKIKSINSNEYKYGLECMRQVKEKTNIENQLPHYLNLLNL